jgi:hypothetical protein
VEQTKKPLRITRFGQPLAKIQPLSLEEYKIDLTRAARDSRDIEIINRNADRLNAEAEDALEYQAPWELDEPKKRLVRKKSRTR